MPCTVATTGLALGSLFRREMINKFLREAEVGLIEKIANPLWGDRFRSLAIRFIFVRLEYIRFEYCVGMRFSISCLHHIFVHLEMWHTSLVWVVDDFYTCSVKIALLRKSECIQFETIAEEFSTFLPIFLVNIFLPHPRCAGKCDWQYPLKVWMSNLCSPFSLIEYLLA